MIKMVTPHSLILNGCLALRMVLIWLLVILRIAVYKIMEENWQINILHADMKHLIEMEIYIVFFMKEVGSC